MYECSVEGYIMVCPIRRNPGQLGSRQVWGLSAYLLYRRPLRLSRLDLVSHFDCMHYVGAQGMGWLRLVGSLKL